MKTSDDCFAILHAAGWSVGDFAVEERGARVCHLYGHRGDQKILGRGLAQGEAWQAAIRSAESADVK